MQLTLEHCDNRTPSLTVGLPPRCISMQLLFDLPTLPEKLKPGGLFPARLV